MLALAIRASVLAVALMVASLVFADELVLSALILVTVALAAVSLLIAPESPAKHSRTGSRSEAETA